MAKIQLNGYGINVDTYNGLVPMDTVFLHGNLASNVWWEPALEVWKKQAKPGSEGRLLMIEWRGNGKSDPPQSEADLKMEKLADDTIEALRKLGVKKACMVTHSTGGTIGLLAMMKAPELFDRVVLLDSVAATGVQFPPEMYAAFTQMETDRPFAEAVMGGTIYQNDPSKPLFAKIVDDAMLAARNNKHGVINALKDLNILGQLANVKQPILVCHGEHDLLLAKEGSTTLAEKLANAQFMEIKGHGHCTNYENPELFVRIVNDFLFKR
jgi:pimeloyl-ACP methyl ester carboxylesterase